MSRNVWGILAAVGLCVPLLASWPTFGGDPQRTSWAKDENTISPETAKSLQLLWKLKLDNQPKELNALTVPIVISPVYTNHGAEEYVIVGGSSDNLYGLDAENGKIVWQKHFSNSAPPPKGFMAHGYYFCPNALNDTPVVGTAPFPEGPTAYVISIDGKLHGLNVVNGEDRFPPKQFVPAYSKNWSLNLANGVIYTSTSQNCNSTKSGIWSINYRSADSTVSFFQTDPFGGGIWGRGGPSLSLDNHAVFGASGDGPFDPSVQKYGDSVLALSTGTLKLLDYYTPLNAAHLFNKDLDMGNTTPMVFSYKGRELVVCAGKEGRLFLLDAKSLGGASHRTPLFRSPLYANEQADIAGAGFWGGFATWVGGEGTRWIYAPAWGTLASNAPQFPLTNGPAPHGSVMAFKVEEDQGTPVLKPAWISQDMDVPEPPVIANGVVFSISSGEFTRQVKPDGTLYTSKEREAKSTYAILYAFDAKTGKELFSSGKTMTSFTHLGGLAVSNGRVFLTTHDSTVYAFGLKEE